MIGRRTAQEWRATFLDEPSVSYCEAVYWAAIRDLSRLETMLDGPRAMDRESPAMVDAIASLNDDWGAEWSTARPRQQLADALRLGRVYATGCRTVPMTHDQWAMTEREAIPVLAWQDVEIADAHGRWSELTAALRPANNLHTMEAGWLDVRFDGESLRRAFPDPSRGGVVGLAQQRWSKAAETAARKELQALFKETPERSMTNDDLFSWTIARTGREDLGRNAFDRAKANAIQDTGATAWGRAGRPRG